MKLLKLSNALGMYAKIDDEDFDRCNKHNWTLSEGRVLTTIDDKQVKLHSFILPGHQKLDHKDCSPLNNCKENLRPATQSQNMLNRDKTAANTSGYKGVTWCKRKLKWKAQLTHQYTNIHCGYFDTPEAAALAYNSKAKLLCGEFARFNEVPSEAH